MGVSVRQSVTSLGLKGWGKGMEDEGRREQELCGESIWRGAVSFSQGPASAWSLHRLSQETAPAGLLPGLPVIQSLSKARGHGGLLWLTRMRKINGRDLIQMIIQRIQNNFHSAY